MPIILRLDRVMADRKISLNQLAEQVGISNVNLSKIKTGKVSAIRFSTLEAICDALDCQPGDILEFRREEEQGLVSPPAARQTGKKRKNSPLPKGKNCVMVYASR